MKSGIHFSSEYRFFLPQNFEKAVFKALFFKFLFIRN